MRINTCNFMLVYEISFSERLFCPTLFVEMRKRLGKDTFDKFKDELIKITNAKDIKQEGKQMPNKGKFKLDATVADQYIS